MYNKSFYQTIWEYDINLVYSRSDETKISSLEVELK